MIQASSILAIMREQVDGYKALLDILQRERTCLVQLQPHGVEMLAKEKDTVVLQLRLIEEERIRLMSAFAAEHRLKEEQVFQALTEESGNDAAQRLKLQLVSLIQSISELNDFNRVLIERSATVVRNALHFLGSIGAATPAMQRSGGISREI